MTDVYSLQKIIDLKNLSETDKDEEKKNEEIVKAFDIQNENLS